MRKKRADRRGNGFNKPESREMRQDESFLEQPTTFQQLKKEWLNSEEACYALSCSKRTLQKYRDNGTLPFSRIGGKIHYKLTDITDLFEEHYTNN